MNVMKVSIIVPTLNRCASLSMTLDSLVNQSCPIFDYEVIVVDNGSVDSTKAIVERVIAQYTLHRIRYIYDEWPGLLTGRHRGALEAEADILTFVDDDIDADYNWLQAIVDTFKDPSVQLVGGRNLGRYEVGEPEWIKHFWIATPHGGQTCGYLSLLDLGDRMMDVNANYVFGLNFSIRRDALFLLGGFHPDCIPDDLQYFQGDGETGLTIKATKMGYRAVYQPRALVYHRIPACRLTPEYFSRRAFYQGVCDSFTTFRNQSICKNRYGKQEIGKNYSLLHSLFRYLQLSVSRASSRLREYARRVLHDLNFIHCDGEMTAVNLQIKQAYRSGYEFHRKAVQEIPGLLEWVLRKDYWDYHLPELGGTRQEIK